ncbi:hypothetical protein ACQCX2_14700 [Propionibacteriaceae bacterium Y1700]|uniref:hypothetical protein n=1 Tax=Microlunatus sp. Y1700 TaxID=3418487 RepID=UPI003DA7285F
MLELQLLILMRHACCENPCLVDWWDGERTSDASDDTDIPEVAASAVAEFAAAAGLTTYAGRMMIFEVLLLRHCLPRTWDLVRECRMPAFRARQLVNAAQHLGTDALRWLDSQAAAVNGRIGRATLERMVARVEAMFSPLSDDDPGVAPFVRIDHRGPGQIGTARLDGQLEIPDALDLGAALQACCADHEDAGTVGDLGTRRALALGDLARHWLGQDSLPTKAQGDPATSGLEPAGSQPTVSAAESRRPVPRVTRVRELTLYVHLAAAAVTGPTTCESSVGECGTTDTVITAEQIRRWCGRPGTNVIIKPVINLQQERGHDRHDPAPFREQTALRDRSCVFPHCDKRAHPVSVRRQADGSLYESTDVDHIQSWEPGDRTSTDGLPICAEPITT